MNEENEVWSEYARIKHMLLDYDQNFREALSAAYMLRKMGRNSQMTVMMLKAQRHVALIYDLGISASAFPEVSKEDDDKMMAIITGQYRGLEPLQWAQNKFREWYRKTGFYNIAIAKDNRPALVRKSG